MNSSELLVDHTEMAEVLFDRSESNSSTSSSCSSNSSCNTRGHSESAVHMSTFLPCKNFNEFINAGRSDEVVLERPAEGADLATVLNKSKDYVTLKNQGQSIPLTVQREINTEEPLGVIYRDAKETKDSKDAIYSFCKEIREIRQKSLHAALEKTVITGKDLELIRTYSVPFEHTKDFGGFASHIDSTALDKFRAVPFQGRGNSRNLGSEELKNLQQMSSRTQMPVQATVAVNFERLRHAHTFFQTTNTNDVSQIIGQFSHLNQQQNLQNHRHYHQHQHSHHHHEITQITQTQYNDTQQHQNQQQLKSFTIDAILGLRGSSQRDKNQRLHTYKKYSGQENTTKNRATGTYSNGTGSSNNSGSSGKLKRVRTIFTAEQLERLEGEFARQQYMVGPERLYLAHALRLTEAQVKVWFQNRRIKWRKLNHEKQSQRLHELHQSGMSATEHEDSNENTVEW